MIEESFENGKKLIVAESAGFCFGVQRAIDTVYAQIETGKKIYTYGEIIHNEEVVQDLENKGVVVIHGLDDIDGKEPGTVIIRSHGVEKKVYDTLQSKGFEIVDATCPFVLKIHRIVERESGNGNQVVIIGDGKHPEVQGICGWSSTAPVTIDTKEEAEHFASNGVTPISVVSQTTFNSKKFKEFVEIIEKKGYNTTVSNTICNATEERQAEARSISRIVSAMVVIGGAKSSNTRKLYEICKKECPKTYLIQTFANLDLSELVKEDSIGITAGASTPNYIIEEVISNVRAEFR